MTYGVDFFLPLRFLGSPVTLPERTRRLMIERGMSEGFRPSFASASVAWGVKGTRLRRARSGVPFSADSFVA